MALADLSTATLVMLLAAAFLAGFVDAMAGGGGLIQIPVMFALFPAAMPATLIGTSKIASLLGTSTAAWQYARRVSVPWNAVWPAALVALCFAFLGAWTLTKIPPDFLRAMLPLILLILAVYTFAKKDFGLHHRPLHAGYRERWRGAASGAAIGFYDGFFGPGTGSFLMFIFIRVFGFDFLRASVAAKLVNMACNVAALVGFAVTGHLWFAVGVVMGLCNAAGSVLGSRLVLHRGSGLIRTIFLVVVTLLIIKTAYDSFLG